MSRNDDPKSEGDTATVRRLVGLPSLSTAWVTPAHDSDGDSPPDLDRRAQDVTYDSLEVQEQPRHDAVAAFASLWLEKCQGARLPARDDFPVEDLHRWFGHVLIMDVGADAQDFRYRMIGTEITAFRDRDYTRKWISECSFGESRESMIATFRNPIIQRRPVFRSGWVQWPVDGSWRSFDSVHCPLATDGRTADMTIGVLYFDAFLPPGTEK
ncbi:MAG: PAS domain-containing protein [Thalassobaculaceae bacterium]|nr:PAS domain-containing protein [Thalassobaculaceae bacterium]